MRAILAVTVALVALGLLAPAALAAAPSPTVATKPAELVRGKQLRIVVKDAPRSFSAIVDATDVRKRFKRAGPDRWVATLRRGPLLRRGVNRISVGAGKGASRRYAAASVVVGNRLAGKLRVLRPRSRQAALRLQVRGPNRHRFEHVRVTLNGEPVRSRDWIVGKRLRGNRWPLGERGFHAVLGRSDGLRFGVNRVTFTAWNRRGEFDRATRTVRISRRAPLVDAGSGSRVPVGRQAVLDGRRTRPAPGLGVRYRWRIVAAPKGSKARLRASNSARPRLRPDLPGRYRVRLVASHAPRPGAGPASLRAAMLSRHAVDEATVEATPAVPPIGLPFRTLAASGGIQVGGTTYPASSGGWVQMLVLDRETLEVQQNLTIGSGPVVSVQEAQELENEIADHGPDQLVIVSGGGRGVDVEATRNGFLEAFFGSIDFLGGNAGVVSDWYEYWNRALVEGHWSIVGVPSVDGSAYQNLYGGSFGQLAEEGSQPGAISGYLQESKDALYEVAQANFTKIDTQVPGSPPGVNRIQVGDATYSSGQVPAGHGGFQVLILDSKLEKTAEQTFVVSDSNGSIEAEVASMQSFISNRTAPELGAPGQLVIVQSIGQPLGSVEKWVNDELLVKNSIGQRSNVTIPRENSTWYAAASSGESVAGALGQLGGAVAHDHFAQLTNLQATDPQVVPGGYTLVASTGQVSGGTPVDAGSEPVSRLQALNPGSQARVVGTLSRDRQSFWSVDDAGWMEGVADETVGPIAYQAPTAWPVSGSAGATKASEYIAERLGLRATDVRTAYWADSGQSFTALLDQLEEVPYPSRPRGFSEATFKELRRQLAIEFPMVDEVYKLFEEWEKVFASTESTGEIDVQAIAKPIVESIDALESGDSTASSTESILSESLWVASSILALSGQEELAEPVGAGAAIFGLTADVSSSGGESSSDGAVVEAEAAKLGPALAERLQNIQENLDMMSTILVSDWGKLQAASSRSKEQWAFNNRVRNQLTGSLERSVKRELTTALLAAAYNVYLVEPRVMEAETPAGIYCTEEESRIGPEGALHPFSDAPENQASWLSKPVGFEQPNGSGNPQAAMRAFGLTVEADIHADALIRHHVNSAPQSVTEPLFSPLDPAQPNHLGQDPLALFADPRFPQRWFYCRPENG